MSSHWLRGRVPWKEAVKEPGNQQGIDCNFVKMEPSLGYFTLSFDISTFFRGPNFSAEHSHQLCYNQASSAGVGTLIISMTFSLHSATPIQSYMCLLTISLTEGFKSTHVSLIYSHLLLGTCTGGKLRLAVHNSSATVTSSGKEQKMGERMGGKPALPNTERSQEMRGSWQLYTGMGGGTCAEGTLNNYIVLTRWP